MLCFKTHYEQILSCRVNVKLALSFCSQHQAAGRAGPAGAGGS